MEFRDTRGSVRHNMLHERQIGCKIEVSRDIRKTMSGSRTHLGDIGLNILTRASPKVDPTEGVSVLCSMGTSRNKVKNQMR